MLSSKSFFNVRRFISRIMPANITDMEFPVDHSQKYFPIAVVGIGTSLFLYTCLIFD